MLLSRETRVKCLAHGHIGRRFTELVLGCKPATFQLLDQTPFTAGLPAASGGTDLPVGGWLWSSLELFLIAGETNKRVPQKSILNGLLLQRTSDAHNKGPKKITLKRTLGGKCGTIAFSRQTFASFWQPSAPRGRLIPQGILLTEVTNTQSFKKLAAKSTMAEAQISVYNATMCSDTSTCSENACMW